MITTILFDLDGTLLPMDQHIFVKSYFGRMAQHLAPYGYEPQLLHKALMAGLDAMYENDGSRTYENAFCDVFCAVLGRNARVDEPYFAEYYKTGFQKVADDCGFNPAAKAAVDALKAKGFTLALATNPLFPAIATHSRLRWAGCELDDFAAVTTYEDTHYCKPDTRYFTELLQRLGKTPQECLMVGNNMEEDMVAATLGMQVFLLTDDLINPHGEDINKYPHGSFAELLAFVDTLN
jgi:HAD superfamily hydrolase (TIGR01509 family)